MSALHVVFVGFDLDRQGRSPAALLDVWRDFGRVEAAVAGDGQVRATIVQAAWAGERREIHGVPCHFVREPRPVVRLPAGRRMSLLPRRLYRQVVALAPDVIHVIGLAFPRQLRGLRRALPGMPIVAQDHATKPAGRVRNGILRWGASLLDGATFTAVEQADALKRCGALPADLPVFEVMEASTPFTPGDRSAARRTTGLTGDPVLLWLGHLDANKDPMTVLDAVSSASEAVPGLRLYMCFREAPLLDAVRRRIDADPSLRARVTLVGPVPYAQIEPYLRSADFVVQASHAEGSGFAPLEALACGTTPLLTDIPAFRRITGGGRFGSLTPVGDGDAMARAIVEWSGRDRATLRAEARAHFEQSLSFEAIARALRRVYLEVLASKRA